MSDLYRSSRKSATPSVVSRPALITAIAGLELAAALWDSRIFLKMDALFPVSWGNSLSLSILMPALMAIAAIYGGVGLMQMKRSAWNVWMVRHAWLCGVYLFSIPTLMWQSMMCPGMSVILTWHFMIIVFSLLAGMYLFATKEQFDNGSARKTR